MSETLKQYRVAYRLPTKQLQDVGITAEATSSTMGSVIRAAVGKYVGSIVGLAEFGESLPCGSQMDEWAAAHVDTLPKLEQSNEASIQNSMFTRFPAGPAFGLKTLARASMRRELPGLVDLMDAFPKRFMVIADDMMLKVLQSERPAAKKYTHDELEALHGKAVIRRNPQAGYLNWPEIRKHREAHAGRFVGEAITQYTAKLAEDPAYIEVREKIERHLQTLQPPQPTF